MTDRAVRNQTQLVRCGHYLHACSDVRRKAPTPSHARAQAAADVRASEGTPVGYVLDRQQRYHQPRFQAGVHCSPIEQTPGATPVVDHTLAVRRSVLDTVLADLSSLKGSVGAQDQLRLDEHFTHLRALEKRLEAEPTLQTASCSKPLLPAQAEDRNAAGQELLGPRMQVMS